MSRFCSPLRYPGGKNCIFNFVSNLLLNNDLVGINYAEPYAGGAGLALRLLFNEYVNQVSINDLDRSIYAFWKTVLENNEEFCEWISRVDIDIKSWNYYKEIQAEKSNASIFELAQSTFFLNRTNVSGVIKGGVIGGVTQQGKYKIDARFKKEDLIHRIKKISKFKNRISLSNLDGLEFVKKIEKSKSNFFIYLDPPYFLKGADLYMNFYAKNDHLKLCQAVSSLKNRWMVSYDDHPFILDLYSSFERINYNLSQSTSNRVGKEIIIFSERVGYKDSLSNLNSANLIV